MKPKAGQIHEKWVVEDWEFTVTVTDGRAADCRAGLEKGDSFVFTYECPAGMCPKVMSELYTWCEVIRCGGDFTYRGSRNPYELDLVCPCGCIRFRLRADPVNRDENGDPLPNLPKPLE